MNKKLLIVFGMVACGIAIGGLIVWAVYKVPQSDHRAAVVDSSFSGLYDRCDEATKVVDAELKRAPATEQTKLVVFLTGDHQTANEPRSLGILNVPVKVKLTESNAAVSDARVSDESRIKELCQKEPPAVSSSIFLSIKRAVEALRGLGCSDSSNCEVLAETDLQENADATIKKALSGDSPNAKNLPAAIDNHGIRIRFCGVSETRGLVKDQKGRSTQLTQNRDAHRIDVIQDVWKSLFAQPELVRSLLHVQNELVHTSATDLARRKVISGILFLGLMVFGLQVLFGRRDAGTIYPFLILLIVGPILLSIGLSDSLWFWDRLPLWMRVVSAVILPFLLIAVLRRFLPKNALIDNAQAVLIDTLVYVITFPLRLLWRSARLVRDRESTRISLQRNRPVVGGRPPLGRTQRPPDRPWEH